MTTLALATMAFAGGAAAANRVDLHGANLPRLKQQYSQHVAARGDATMAHTRHEQLLQLDPESRLVLMDRHDSHGVRNTRYQQTFRGIPVWGEQVIVSEDGRGNVRTLFGRKIEGLASDLPAQALRAGIAQGKALGLARQAAFGARLTSMSVQRQKATKMIYVDDNGGAHLAWVVDMYAEGNNKATRPQLIIDARSGKVLRQWEGLTTDEIGTGPGGNAKTGQYEWGSGGRYGFLDVAKSGSTCTMNNPKVRGVNLNGYSSQSGGPTTAYSYTCPRNTFKTINGGYSPINDAFYFGGLITNMYPDYTGYEALNIQLLMRVHYGTQYENAFWNGASMNFGDGKNTFYPLVSADVAGHEVSHGFTEQHSGLVYSGQSGGMNEAFSDMGGEATEYYWKGSNDFLVGQEIFKGNGALRYMANPTQDGSSIDNAADYYSGINPHYSSGVYNKAFYLLSTTSGWDVPKAFKVMARANAEYWTSSSTYVSGACGVETAADDLGYSVSDVSAAFAAVGVDCPGGGGGGGSTGGPLTKGVAETGVSASIGNDIYYTLEVPAGASGLTFSLDGSNGDADLYVKFGGTPSTGNYDCKSETSTSHESCSIASPSTGTYNVLVHAYATYSGLSVLGDYTAGGGNANTPPVADFTFTTSGLTASFTDGSSDSDGSIASRSWNFGDGGSSTSTNPSHAYASAGTYTVTETVTDDDGATDSKSASVTVSGGGGGGCNGTLYSGTLASGASEIQPNGTYFISGAGTQTGVLDGPTGADFDLRLYKYNSYFGWLVVKSGLTPSNHESVSYSGTSGIYLWQVASASGSGSYTLCIDHP